tara:strand:+ start:5386 stop:5835 length:450 start_codon:yes stop_codon:yes gene_type:complete
LINSSINDLEIISLRIIEDDRGAVLHMLRSDSDIYSDFGELYFSETKPGIVKAWKCNSKLTQLLAVPKGRIRLVIFDDRLDSSSKGELQILEVGRPDAYQLIKIPNNLWYGFKCISTEPALIANCTNGVHSPDNTRTKNYDNPSIPFSW